MLSHAPWLRYKEDNILISMLFPDGLSPDEQAKFFNKVIEVDFNPIFTDGVEFYGQKCKVEIFGHVSGVCHLLVVVHAFANLLAQPHH